ncbi:MAG: diacylglycerol kinase [Flavisolibacter sp.]|jgi:YegS/Rv2252/BmrU family lipid kinase|nr:diacylglycerol kinase [Flavisolibacter sp.]
MDRRFIYIVNPISGTRDKNNLLATIHAKTYAAGFGFEVYDSVADGNYSFLYPSIEENGVTDIVVVGGDGTINQVVDDLRKFDISFGIIPSGSGNGLAFSAGLQKDPAKSLETIFKGNTKMTDAFTVNGTFACMLCGLGFDAQVAHDFGNDPRRGLLTYIKKTISNFFTASAYPFIIDTGERQMATDAFFISVANSNQFGNHFTIAPGASLTDGLLDIVVISKQNKLGVLYCTAKQVCGFNKIQKIETVDEKSLLIYFQTNKLKIQNLKLAPMHIDGDPVETASEIEIELIKNCFKLIYP